MDFQNRVGHKTGSGAPATSQDVARERKERLKRLAMETVDLSKDPYILKNHIGQYECKLCLTIHVNEASYLSHTQGKKHQLNLTRRAAKERAESATILPQPRSVIVKRAGHSVIQIGRPGYRVTKVKCPSTGDLGLLFEIDLPDIAEGTTARHRFMSAWEQKVEASDSKFQYVIFAADPYESIAFRIPNMEVDRSRLQTHWSPAKKTYVLQFLFKTKRESRILPALQQKPATFLPIGVRW